MLIHLNGPACVGKSTIAQRLAERRPLSLLLDIDLLRMQLGSWADEPESKALARSLAYAMTAHHLAAGYDVVMPQLDSRPEVLERLAAMAADAGAEFRSIVLTAGVDELVRRLDRQHPDDAHPRKAFSAAELRSQIEYSLAQLPTLAEEHLDACVVDVSGLGPDMAAKRVEECLESF